jgi:hypothetical protein
MPVMRLLWVNKYTYMIYFYNIYCRISSICEILKNEFGGKNKSQDQYRI